MQGHDHVIEEAQNSSVLVSNEKTTTHKIK